MKPDPTGASVEQARSRFVTKVKTYHFDDGGILLYPETKHAPFMTSEMPP